MSSVLRYGKFVLNLVSKTYQVTKGNFIEHGRFCTVCVTQHSTLPYFTLLPVRFSSIISRSHQNLDRSTKKSDRAELKYLQSKLRRLPASSIGRRTAEAILNISFSALEESKTIHAEKMISITKAPPELLELVYTSLCEILNVNDYPTKLTTEIDRSFFVRATLTCITNYVSRKFAVEDRRLKIVVEHDISIQIPKEGIAVRTKIDQVINIGEGDGNNYIVVVECKRWNVDDGLEQCCIGMKACFEANKDDRTVYGFCTVAERWNFITYDKLNGFKMMAAIDVMFTEMVSEKQIWLEKYTKIIDIIYTCLLNIQVKRVETKHMFVTEHDNRVNSMIS